MKIKIAKILIALPTIWYGVIPPIVDISTSHLINPHWPAHARFHMMWLLTSSLLLSILSLFHLLREYPDKILGGRIAGIISLCIYSGFFVSFLTMNFYGGSLNDENGVDMIFGINANLLFFIPLTILLTSGTLILFFHPRK